MTALKKILIAVDFSQASREALDFGRMLADACDATLHLLHVVRHPIETPELAQVEERHARERLDALLNQADREARGATTSCRIGTPAHEIVAYASDQAIDLIVMGTHINGPAFRMATGSIAEAVVGLAPCAVLTLKSGDGAARSAGKSALFIVDVQRDFCSGGALPVPDGDPVVASLNRYIADATARRLAIYASRDWHPAVTDHFKPYGGTWPVHCVQNTDGARFHPDLKLPPTVIIVSKGDRPDGPGYSAFEGHTSDGATLLADLRRHGIDHLWVGGLATDYCVKHTVLDALAAGLKVTVLQDAVAGVDLHPGDSTRALADMQQKGARLRAQAELDDIDHDRTEAPRW